MAQCLFKHDGGNAGLPPQGGGDAEILAIAETFAAEIASAWQR